MDSWTEKQILNIEEASVPLSRGRFTRNHGNALEVVRGMKESGKVPVVAGRWIAARFLLMVTACRKLLEKAQEARGGPTIDKTFRGGLGECSLSSPQRRLGGYGGMKDILIEIGHLLGFGIVEVKNNMSFIEATGPEQHIETYATLTQKINAATQQAYEMGFEDGKKLLQLIAAGEITVSKLSAIEKGE